MEEKRAGKRGVVKFGADPALVEPSLKDDVTSWVRTLMEGSENWDLVIDYFEKLTEVADLNQATIGVFFDGEFGEFVIHCLRNSPSSRPFVAIFHLITRLIAYDEDILRFFDEKGLMELAGRMVTQDDVNLQEYALNIYCQMMVCHQENDPIPFDVPQICEWVDYVLDRLVSNRVVVEMAHLLKMLIKYRDFERYLPRILGCMAKLGSKVGNSKVLGIIADAVNLVVYCCDDPFFMIYNEELINLFTAHIANESSVRRKILYLAPYLEVIRRLLGQCRSCKRLELVMAQVQRIGFTRLIDMVQNESVVISNNAIELICEILSIEGNTGIDERRGRESMRVLAAKGKFDKIVADLIETFDDNPFDRKVSIARLIQALLKAHVFSCYTKVMETEFLANVSNMAACTADTAVLKVLVSLVTSVVSVAKRCDELQMVQAQLVEHQISEFVMSLVEVNDSEIAYYVSKYDRLMREINGEGSDDA